MGGKAHLLAPKGHLGTIWHAMQDAKAYTPTERMLTMLMQQADGDQPHVRIAANINVKSVCQVWGRVVAHNAEKCCIALVTWKLYFVEKQETSVIR